MSSTYILIFSLSVEDVMRILRVLLILTTGLLFFSCGKESADLDNDLVTSLDGKTTNINCNGLDLSKNLLKKNSVLKIFGCIGWKNEYPRVYGYLNDLSKKDYDLIFSPINDHLFGSLEKRNAFLSFVQSRVSKKEISVVSHEIQKFLNDKIFLNSLTTISQDINFNLPSKNMIDKAIDFFKVISLDTEINRNNIKNSISILESHIEAKEQFTKLELSVYEKLVKAKSNFSSLASDFLMPAQWPVNFLDKYQEKDIYKLVTYTENKQNLNEDLSFLDTSFRLNLNNCSEFNSIYYLDYQKELDERLEVLATTNKVTFLMDVFELSERFSLFNNICPYVEFNTSSARVLTHLRNYAVLPGGYEFMKGLAKTSLDNKNPYLIFEIVNSDTFEALAKTMVLDEMLNSGVLRETVNFLSSFSNESFTKMISLLDVFGEESIKGTFTPLGSLLISERKHLISKILNEIILDDSLEMNIAFIQKVFNRYGSIYTSYEHKFSNDKISYAFWFYKLSEKLKNEKFKKEFVDFWNEDVFFKLISFIAQKSDVNIVKVKETPVRAEELKEELRSDQEETELSSCIVQFNELSQVDYDFWHLLKNYPQTCIDLVTKKSLSSYIFQWTIDIDKIFNDEFGTPFSYRYGMIAPEMMSFYHSLMHIINTHLSKKDGYVGSVIGNIRSELFDKGLLRVLENTAIVLDKIFDKTSFAEKSMEKLISINNRDFDLAFKALLKPFQYEENITKFSKYDCKSSNMLIGANPCFSSSDLEAFLLETSDLLIRDNGAKQKLYEKIVDFILSEKGIKIPFRSRRQRFKKLDIEELIRFLFDMTSTKTQKKISFKTQNTTKEVLTNRAERLEVVIREISFLNNFYGAFFMNTVARAKKYYKKVKSMKKNVTVMDNTAAFFRRRGVFPVETKWAFKNILETYSSLYELERKHSQPDGGYKRYGDFIQAILTLVVETSSLNSQRYTPFQSPKPNMVEKHNGMFITKITELGLLSQMGNWIRNISSNDLLSIIKNEDFIRIKKNINKLMTPDRAKNLIKFVLTHKNKSLMIKDLSTFIYKLDHKDNENFLNLLWKSLGIISKIDQKQFGDEIIPIIKVIINNYDQLRDHELLNFDSKFLYEITKFFSKVDKLSSRDLNLLSSAFLVIVREINVRELDEIIKNKEFIDGLSKMKLATMSYLGTASYKTGFLSDFVKDKQLNFSPLQMMLINVHREQRDFQYIKNIVKILSQKRNNKTNLEIAVREIFIEKDEIVIKFLTDMFNKFYRPSIH